jgi:hypothetical protein
MRFVVPRRQLRLAASFLTLIIVLGGVLLTATQCRMVTDTLTGVNFSKSGNSPGNCVARCAHQKNESFATELELNRDNNAACNGDPDCLSLERDRHAAAMQAIMDAFFACKANCHHQGAGSGG